MSQNFCNNQYSGTKLSTFNGLYACKDSSQEQYEQDMRTKGPTSRVLLDDLPDPSSFRRPQTQSGYYQNSASTSLLSEFTLEVILDQTFSPKKSWQSSTQVHMAVQKVQRRAYIMLTWQTFSCPTSVLDWITCKADQHIFPQQRSHYGFVKILLKPQSSGVTMPCRTWLLTPRWYRGQV